MGDEKQLSAEEVALFRDSVADVRPLGDRAKQPPQRPRPRVQRPIGGAAVSVPDETGFSTRTPEPKDLTGEPLAYSRAGIQARVLRRLKRGQMRPQDSLDLHGMRSEEASRRLATFLSEAQSRNLHVVHLVHGKGRGSGREGPRLKALLDRWLRLRPEVVAYCTAQPADGGTGAVYVLLRRGLRNN